MPKEFIMPTENEAKEQIQSFHERYYGNTKLVKNNAEARNRHNRAKEEAKSKEVADICHAKYNNLTDLARITKLQGFFRKQILNEYPLSISHFNKDSSLNYPDGFMDFIGKDSGAKRSLNVAAVRELAEAVNRGDWDAICYENYKEQYSLVGYVTLLQRRAISAAANGSITIEQCATLLRYTSFLKGSNGEVSINCLVNER